MLQNNLFLRILRPISVFFFIFLAITFSMPCWSMINFDNDTNYVSAIGNLQKYKPVEDIQTNADASAHIPTDLETEHPLFPSIPSIVTQDFSISNIDDQNNFIYFFTKNANNNINRSKKIIFSTMIANNLIYTDQITSRYVAAENVSAEKENSVVLSCPLNEHPDLKYKMYILLGYPGAGKGTFAEILKDRGYKHISTGDILRDEVKRGTCIGLQYKQAIESSSQLLPQEVVDSIILNKIQNLIKEKERIILDGFPKTMEQAIYLKLLIDTHSLSQNVHVVYLDIPLDIALERIQSRKTCSECGEIYNLQTAQPMIIDRCDTCGASLVQRSCDTDVDFWKRIALFTCTVAKVIDYYKKQEILRTINSNLPLKNFIEQVISYDQI